MQNLDSLLVPTPSRLPSPITHPPSPIAHQSSFRRTGTKNCSPDTALTLSMLSRPCTGLGQALVSKLLLRSAHTVIGAIRTAVPPTSLTSLPRHATSSLLTVCIDSAPDATLAPDTARQNSALRNGEAGASTPQPRVTSADAALRYLREEHGIERIDVVVAAAGMAVEGGLKSVLETEPEVVLRHVDVNMGGVLRLVRELWPLLGGGASGAGSMEDGEGGRGTDRAGSGETGGAQRGEGSGGSRLRRETKFVVISSSVGSIGGMMPAPSLAYGVSKAAVNFLVKKLHTEWPGGCVVAVHPG